MKQPHSQWMDSVLARISRLPGVEAAGAVRLRPFQLGAIGYDSLVIKPGQAQTIEEGQKNPFINVQIASVDYFRSMRIPLRRGRLFTADDTTRAPRVVILSETAARRLFPGQEAVGQRLAIVRLSTLGKPPDWLTVAGVVSDVRYRGLDDVRLDVYQPAFQTDEPAGVIVVRAASGNPVALAAAIQAEVRQVDPRAVIGGVTTMEAVVGREMAPWRFSTWLFGLFAALAFVLATVGLFGVVSLDVLHRSREFAVRLALGAQRRAILVRVLRSAALRVLTGVAARRARRGRRQPVDAQPAVRHRAVRSGHLWGGRRDGRRRRGRRLLAAGPPGGPHRSPDAPQEGLSARRQPPLSERRAAARQRERSDGRICGHWPRCGRRSQITPRAARPSAGSRTACAPRGMCYNPRDPLPIVPRSS